MITVLVVILTLGAVCLATVTWFRQRLLASQMTESSNLT
jgi:hypothetical protein